VNSRGGGIGHYAGGLMNNRDFFVPPSWVLWRGSMTAMTASCTKSCEQRNINQRSSLQKAQRKPKRD